MNMCALYLTTCIKYTPGRRVDWKAKHIPCHVVSSIVNLCFHFVQKTDNNSDLQSNLYCFWTKLQMRSMWANVT